MEFLIMSRHMIEDYQLDNPHIVISIVEPRLDYPILSDKSAESRLYTLRLCYTDEDEENYSDPKAINDQKLFNRAMADKILNTVAQYKDHIDTIICQCDGGVSRSSGTAAALSVILNGSRSDNWIFNSRGYVPNKLVYRTILNKYQELLD